MELQQLQYFLVAAHYEHITKAADILHIAQPALSQSIRRLENELGVELFDRKKGSIALNSSGKLLQNELIPILDTLNKLPTMLKSSLEAEKKTVHLNITAASTLITNCIISYKTLHPDINFQLSQNAGTKDFDLTIQATLPNHLSAESHLILEEEFFLAVPLSSAYASRTEISLREVSGEKFISLAGSIPLRSMCDQFCHAAGFSPNVMFESDHSEAVKNLIGAGLGIGFWPQYSWGPITTGNVALIPIVKPVCKRDIVVIYNQNRPPSPIVNGFYAYLKEYVEELRK